MTAKFIDPRSPQGLYEVLAHVGLRPNKQLGQHFLTDPTVFEKMAAQVASTHPQWVLEIGPGPGGLTVSLLEKGLNVVAVELDGAWARWLQDSLAKEFPEQLSVIHADAVTTSWQGLVLARQGRFNICGNLPYYVSSALMAKLFEDVTTWDTAIVMLQKEVALRLVAEPGQRQTSALSVLLRYVAHVEALMPVARAAFSPPPDVDSFVIQLTRRPSPMVPLTALQWVVHSAFSHRRKMIRQSLAMAPGSAWNAQGWTEVLQHAGLDAAKRPEALSWQEWIALAKLVATK